jgi:hypothetical protein
MVRHDRGRADDRVLDERVASLLEAAAAPAEPGPLPGEVEAVVTYRAARARARDAAAARPRARARAALAGALGVGVLLTGGVGAATAGALPGPAQDRVGKLLSRVGVDVPGSRERSEDRRPEQESTDAAQHDLPEAAEKGRSLSEEARSEGLSGADKGAGVSGHASGGHSDAGAWRDRDATDHDDAEDDGGWARSERTRGDTEDRDEDSDEATRYDDECDREADDERTDATGDEDDREDDRETDSDRHREAYDGPESDCGDDVDQDDRQAEDDEDTEKGDTRRSSSGTRQGD